MKNKKEKNKCIVITTINEAKNNALKEFSKLKDYDLIIVGDTKSPEAYDIKCTYIPIEAQDRDFPTFFNLIPFSHYARKNFGYLYAIKNGYETIAESDDDNYPYKDWFTIPQEKKFKTIISPEYPNIYSHFTKKKIWPRGYPLQLITKKDNQIKYKNDLANVLIWQGLVDGDPDVDAIYRLTIGEDIVFSKNKNVVLEQGVISAFNTQNTVWVKEAQYLMYLPFSVNFRYTDILRSFVAQFGIWALGGKLGFTSPTALQKRNEHDLLHDFEDEVQMHLLFNKVMQTLEGCHLKGNCNDLIIMYKALHVASVVSKKELTAVKEWVRLYKSYA